jgi:phage gp36-like protein
MYVTQSQIHTAIPAQHLNDALDDDGDGLADPGLLDAIISSASQAVDAFLAGLYTVPFADPAPAVVAEAAFVFACERIYDRRRLDAAGDQANPWRARANSFRERLEKISRNQLKLDQSLDKPNTPGALITESPAIDASTR